MKNFLFSLIAIVFVSTNTFAQDFTKILNDPNFETFLRLYEDERLLPKDIEAIKDFNADGKIDEVELETLYKHIGYATNDEFKENLVKKSILVDDLNKNHNLKQYTEEELSTLFDLGLTKFGLDSHLKAEGSNCKRKRRNCYTIAFGVAVGAHIACGTADVTVVLGLLCHGAATAGHYAMQDDCDLNYLDCING